MNDFEVETPPPLSHQLIKIFIHVLNSFQMKAQIFFLALSLITTSTLFAKRVSLEQTARNIYAAIDANDAVTLRKLLTVDYLFYNPFTPTPLNADGLIGFSDQTAKAFTGAKHSIKQIITAGKKVTVIATFMGKHTGVFNGIPATGKDVSMDLISVIEFNEKDMATVQWTQANTLGLMIQLGVVPPPNPNSNVPNVISLFQAFGKGDVPGLVGMLDENIEWDSQLNPLFKGRVYRGQKDVYNFFGGLKEASQITNFQPINFYEKENEVNVLGFFDYTRLSDSKKFHVKWTMVFKFKNGRPEKFVEFFESPTAL